MVATRLHRVGRLGSGIEGLRELDDFKLAECVRTKYMELANWQIFKPSISEEERAHGRASGTDSAEIAAVADIFATTAPSPLQTSTCRL